ncbi:MAG: cytochrome c oxidase subunit II [Bacteroidota bacterium]|nr:cytochrome c oxidase subunit II [Bacteroidota bacterium]MDP4234624.1 cytochrome c oxidase subunit II [Bacteroidota bacterium]MDP4243777.1 cytochrome c oxidase subunit II [Bacteroidota bacterium]MDP4288985.1 cytochrome c oxidase subunit II [Bacteroidota bacterium]
MPETMHGILSLSTQSIMGNGLRPLLGMSWMLPDQASTYAPDVDNLYLFLVGLTIFFTVLISAAILYFFVKYRRRSNSEIPRPIAGSIVLESTWSIIPLLISFGIFAWGANIYLTEYTVPNDALDIYVVGKQWMWKFQHPEGQREINELHIPVGKKIRFIMATEDVIHSFFIPAFRMKEDIVPGPSRYSTVWAEATQTGTFHIFCAEYCGTSHSGMIGWVTVMNDKDYQAWLSGGAATGTMAERGAALFQQLGCITCHKSDGTGPCPKLEGIYGKQQDLEGGTSVLADDSYVRESILSPTAKIVKGYKPLMPSFQGIVSEEQLQQLIAYVKSIGTPVAAPAPGKGAAPGSVPAAVRPPIMTSSASESIPPQNEKAGSESQNTQAEASAKSAGVKR